MRLLATALVIAGLLAGCGGEPGTTASPEAGEPNVPAPGAEPSPSPEPLATRIALDPLAPAPGILQIRESGAELTRDPDGAAVGTLRAGVLVPYLEIQGSWIRITTPCQNPRWIHSTDAYRLARPTVVIDPGHGGDERGAEGPTGLLEKDVNLQVALVAAEQLNASGVPAVTTRTSDYRATLGFRASVASSGGAEILLSVHHNAEPDGPSAGPGSETFYQFTSDESKRLAGLVYRELVSALSPVDAAWVADTDAGAKWRLNSRGEDYYGLLRRALGAGIPAVLAELSFISNAAEEALLRDDDFLEREAGALARAVERYLKTDEPGSGYTTPYPRTEPAGPGGGLSGCVDPE